MKPTPKTTSGYPHNLTSPSATLGEILGALEQLIKNNPFLARQIEHLPAGYILLREGKPNKFLYLLLHGQVQFFKHTPFGEVYVSSHEAGELLGVNSYVSHTTSFCTCKVTQPVRCLRLDPHLEIHLSEVLPQARKLLDKLITANLASRYRKAVSLQIELIEANQHLKETRNKLIHQEKLATLGQMVAGLAHELNNPISAMLRACDHITDTLHHFFTSTTSPDKWREFWQAGTESLTPDTPTVRQTIKELKLLLPHTTQAVIRQIAQIPSTLREIIINKIQSQRTISKETESLLDIYDIATLIHTLETSAIQISHLVNSLKNYARPSSAPPCQVNLKESIHNSLIILGSLLRQHHTELQIPNDLYVWAHPGDLGQIWTNLIKNACEAMPAGGLLKIAAKPDDDFITVTISDNGPGVPPHLKEKIFELNYTTKTGAENFGLGLGLPITIGLVARAGGKLTLTDTPGGGATFQVTLPRKAL